MEFFSFNLSPLINSFVLSSNETLNFSNKVPYDKESILIGKNLDVKIIGEQQLIGKSIVKSMNE